MIKNLLYMIYLYISVDWRYSTFNDNAEGNYKCFM